MLPLSFMLVIWQCVSYFCFKSPLSIMQRCQDHEKTSHLMGASSCLLCQSPPTWSSLFWALLCARAPIGTQGSKQTLRASFSVDLFPPWIALSTQTYKSLSAQVPRKSGHRCPLLHPEQWSILGSKVPCFGGMVLAPLWPRPIKIMSVSGPAWPRASNCDIRSS